MGERVIVYIVVSVVSLWVGLLVGYSLHIWTTGRKDPDGIIKTHHQDGKMIYSLELNGNPEEIEFMDKVVFNVEHRIESD